MTMTYGIGDKVVHPNYGAGVVTKVVRRTIGGGPRQYYLIEPLALSDTEIMVPVERANGVGLRNAVKPSEMERALTALEALPDTLSTDHKERQALIREKLGSQDPHQLAEVARDLAAFRRMRGGRLGAEDIRLLKRSRECLAGELALVESLSFEAALDRIDDTLMLTDQALQPPI